LQGEQREKGTISEQKENMMRNQENKQLVMEGYKRFQNKDIAGLLELFADDIEWVGLRSEAIPFSGDYHGKQQTAQFFTLMDQAQEALQFEPQEFIAEGDKVVVTGQAKWAVKSNGQTYESPWVHIFTIRDGKVARFHQFNDTAAAVEAFRPYQQTLQQTDATTSVRH
jgi:ketosteroid isomerase-like protein